MKQQKEEERKESKRGRANKTKERIRKEEGCRKARERNHKGTQRVALRKALRAVGDVGVAHGVAVVAVRLHLHHKRTLWKKTENKSTSERKNDCTVANKRESA